MHLKVYTAASSKSKVYENYVSFTVSDLQPVRQATGGENKKQRQVTLELQQCD